MTQAENKDAPWAVRERAMGQVASPGPLGLFL